MSETMTKKPETSVRTSTMKKLEVIIRPSQLDAVQKAMAIAGYAGVTVTSAQGHGTQKGRQGVGYLMELVPKIRLEMVIPDSALEAMIDAVSKAAKTGQVGDGKIFISDIRDVIRIRTGERGEAAI